MSQTRQRADTARTPFNQQSVQETEQTSKDRGTTRRQRSSDVRAWCGSL
jgi:hypothetical protein